MGSELGRMGKSASQPSVIWVNTGPHKCALGDLGGKMGKGERKEVDM